MEKITKLALSGGGFRATLFHLGVIRCLCENDQLNSLTHITSVSGGSILAAHLALNWKEYTNKSPVEFGKAADKVVALVRRDVSGRIFHKWLVARLLLTVMVPVVAGICTFSFVQYWWWWWCIIPV